MMRENMQRRTAGIVSFARQKTGNCFLDISATPHLRLLKQSNF